MLQNEICIERIKAKIQKLKIELEQDNKELSIIENYKRRNMIEYKINEQEELLRFYKKMFNKLNIKSDDRRKNARNKKNILHDIL